MASADGDISNCRVGWQEKGTTESTVSTDKPTSVVLVWFVGFELQVTVTRPMFIVWHDSRCNNISISISIIRSTLKLIKKMLKSDSIQDASGLHCRTHCRTHPARLTAFWIAQDTSSKTHGLLTGHTN